MNQAGSWLKLDNAGKIFPSTSGKRNTGVFRFSCELTERIQKAPLQQALDQTLECFPHFLYILRNGLFWYYLEAGDLRPKVHEENTGVCSQLFYRNQRHLLFDVSYYRKRINLEVYHALTDGTGALQFLQYLLCAYLSGVHPGQVPRELADELSPAPISSRAEDSFKKYYQHVKKVRSGLPGRAYRLTGRFSEEYRVTEGLMSCRKVLDLAKAYDSTLTVFLCALLMISIHREMMLYKEKKPVVITVPVNLRQYFSSETTRNFFGNIRVAYRFQEGEENLEDIIASLKSSFERELTQDRLKSRISGYMAVERNPFAKIAPLSFKNFCLRIARRVSDFGETMVVSNVGKVKLPEEISPFVESFSVFASTAKLQVCVCSCGDTLSVGFSSRYEDTDIQRNFFRLLSGMGVDVEIKSNASVREKD